MPEGKRPAHRPARYPGEEMATLSVRMPVRLKNKLEGLAGVGRAAEWICQQIEMAELPATTPEIVHKC